MVVNPLSDGSVTGTGTLPIESGILGGIVISANGTDSVTIKVHADNNDGEVRFQIATKSPMFIAAPFKLGSQVLYYSVVGTGGAVHLFEWVE